MILQPSVATGPRVKIKSMGPRLRAASSLAGSFSSRKPWVVLPSSCGSGAAVWLFVHPASRTDLMTLLLAEELKSPARNCGNSGAYSAASARIILICSSRAGALMWSRWVLSTRSCRPEVRSRSRTQFTWRARADSQESEPGRCGVSESQKLPHVTSS